MAAQRIGLVTGATGYGGRLVVEQLLRSGWRVKTLARSRGADCAW
ncbi:NAD-dependent epimerase/dehydratase family protein [Corynebacterium afermentans]